MSAGELIFLGNSVLLDRKYCPSWDNMSEYLLNQIPPSSSFMQLIQSIEKATKSSQLCNMSGGMLFKLHDKSHDSDVHVVDGARYGAIQV